MSSEKPWGFTPSPSKGKLEITPTEPKVVNNYFTIVINPQAVLLVVLLIIVACAFLRTAPQLRA
jgi:hypothetical protein